MQLLRNTRRSYVYYVLLLSLPLLVLYYFLYARNDILAETQILKDDNGEIGISQYEISRDGNDENQGGQATEKPVIAELAEDEHPTNRPDFLEGETSSEARPTETRLPTKRPSPQKPSTKSSPKAADPIFEKLRGRWKSTLIASDIGIDPKTYKSVPEIASVLKQLSDTAKQLLDNLQTKKGFVWPDLQPLNQGDNFRISYQRLYLISLAYSVAGTRQHNNAKVLGSVLDSLDVISSNAFNASTWRNEEENWWNYRIGAPDALMDISMLLYSQIGTARRKAYADTVNIMVGNVAEKSLNSANRANICQALLAAALLIDNKDNLAFARDCFEDKGHKKAKNSVFAISEHGEGFRTDGGFIAHKVYPYAGGYGVDLMLAVARSARILNNSPYGFRPYQLKNLYRAIETTFTPVMFRGMFMAPFRGREIARRTKPDSFAANLFMKALLNLADIAPKEYQKKFRASCKRWAEETSWPDMGGANISQALKSWKIQNPELSEVSAPKGMFVFPSSGRIVYHRNTWSAALSISSDRTGRYESLNSENMRSWYQGDGMLYLYLEKDPLHYTNDYWPTMDPYHTPGVTNALNTLPPPLYKTMGLKAWAGGVKWGQLGHGFDYGSASLDHLAVDKGSHAKKSWFFIPDAIVSLGAACSGSKGTELHTTIESRNLPDPDMQLVIDGKKYKENSKYSFNKSDAKWAHIENVGGYLFLDGGDVSFTRESRTGKWTDINSYPEYVTHNDSLTRDYLTITRNHGVDPSNSFYAHVILPDSSPEVTADFSADPGFVVLKNTAKVQALSLNGGRIYMANFWRPGKIGALKVKKPCAVIWGYESDGTEKYTLSLSDPSQLSRKVEVVLDAGHVASVLTKDKTVTIKWPAKEGLPIRILVDTSKYDGKTHSVTFERSAVKSEQ